MTPLNRELECTHGHEENCKINEALVMCTVHFA